MRLYVRLAKDGALCEIRKVQNKKRSVFQSLSWPMVMEGRRRNDKREAMKEMTSRSGAK